jgi:hypothetical protein
MGRTDKPMGRTDELMGRTDKRMGRTDKPMGRTDKPMGRQPVKVIFKAQDKSKQVQIHQYRPGKKYMLSKKLSGLLQLT